MYHQRFKSPIERFWEKVRKTDGHDACWEWAGSRRSNGYGRLYIDGKFRSAHRFIFEQVNGPIREGWFVCHKCDNPSCVRPSHLFQGSPAHNMHDRDRKGRACKGVRHHAAKLNDDQVREIRRMLVSGKKGKDVARLFGVTASLIAQINIGKQWRHVQ